MPWMERLASGVDREAQSVARKATARLTLGASITRTKSKISLFRSSTGRQVTVISGCMPQRDRRAQRDCNMRRGTTGHQRDDTAGPFVSLRLFSLPSEKFFEQHQFFGSIWRVVSLPRRPENFQIYCLRQRAHLAEYGGKALNHGGAWYRNLSLFEGDDRRGEAGNRDCAADRSVRCRARRSRRSAHHPAREHGQSPGAAGGAGNW